MHTSTPLFVCKSFRGGNSIPPFKRLEQSWKSIPNSVNPTCVTLREYGIMDTILEICDKYQVSHRFLVIEGMERVGLIDKNIARP